MKVLESLAKKFYKKSVALRNKLFEKTGLHCKNKADSVHVFHNDEISQITNTVFYKIYKKPTYFVLKVSGGQLLFIVKIS